MRDGQIGEIVQWSDPKHIGRIVQRFGSDIITIGMPKGESWSGICNRGEVDGCQIRLLEVGETLEIEHN